MGKSPNVKEAHRLPISHASIGKGWRVGSGAARIQRNPTILGTVQITAALTGRVNLSVQMIKYQMINSCDSNRKTKLIEPCDTINTVQIPNPFLC